MRYVLVCTRLRARRAALESRASRQIIPRVAALAFVRIVHGAFDAVIVLDAKVALTDVDGAALEPRASRQMVTYITRFALVVAVRGAVGAIIILDAVAARANFLDTLRCIVGGLVVPIIARTRLLGRSRLPVCTSPAAFGRVRT